MKRSACIRCGARHKVGAVRCPKCHLYLVSKVADRFVLHHCMARKKDRLSFLARDTWNDNDVFVRVTLPTTLPEAAEALVREAKLLLALRGEPVLPEFIGGGNVSQTGGVYSAIEYVHGDELESAIRRLTLENKVALLQKVAEAVAVLHGYGCVHSSLSPASFRCDATGHVRVVDFTQAVPAGALYCGRGIGSYAPPEQCGVGTQAAFTADVFSLAASFYFLLAGKLPFGKAGIGGTKAVFRLAPPSVFNNALTPTLDEAIMKALAQNPADRYANAMEFARALHDNFGSATVADGLPYAFPSKAHTFGIALWRGISEATKATCVFARSVWRGFDQFAHFVGHMTGLDPTYFKVGTAGAAALAMVALPMLNSAWAIRSRDVGVAQTDRIVKEERSNRHKAMDGTLTLADPSELAFVQFHAWPPAMVSVDGAFLVEAPSPRWFPLSPGQHEVVVTANDGKHFEIPFIATADKLQVIQCQFDERWWRIQEVVK